MCVLEHVLNCDVERLELLKLQETLPNIDTTNMEPENKLEIANRLTAVTLRLDAIDAKGAE